MSGITIDEDVYIKIDERKYIEERTGCPAHEDNYEVACPDCQNALQLVRTQLTGLDDTELKEAFVRFVQTHPFRPSQQDIFTTMQMCNELKAFISERFGEDIGYPIILCRNNIRTNLSEGKKTVRSVDNSDGTTTRYYRYGFHIFLFGRTVPIEGKQYIKQNF